MNKKLQRGCVVYMAASSGLKGYGNEQCVSWVSHELGELSLFGHNQHYKTYDVRKVVSYPESTPPVSAMEDETEKIFKPYCIDFFSKESEEERKIKIDFALNKKNESFSLFQSMYDQNYGSINIDENLVSIHTGGWSENEYLISIFKNTEWWRQNFRIQITGGHYYFDTDRINGMKEWDITKRISTTPTK